MSFLVQTQIQLKCERDLAMWIPYFLFEFWEPETDIESTRASEADHEERKLEIWFFLENPPTRRREVELRLAEAQVRTLTDGSGRQATIRFDPNDDRLLKAVGFRVRDTNAKAAFRYCYNLLCQQLSVWAVATGSGFSIFGLRIIDSRHNATWKVVPQQAAPDEFFLPASVVLSPQHAAIISLYREGRNAQSPFYRFLCCYKILEAWYRSGGIFATADRLVRERNLPFRRPRRTITQDMLVLSLVFNSRPEFREVTFGEYFERLNPWRVKVAHAVTEAGEFVNFDHYETQIELGPVANLTELVARQILLDELELWRQIEEAGTTSSQ